MFCLELQFVGNYEVYKHIPLTWYLKHSLKKKKKKVISRANNVTLSWELANTQNMCTEEFLGFLVPFKQ